jgi:hypothetical protein
MMKEADGLEQEAFFVKASTEVSHKLWLKPLWGRLFARY